MHFGLVLYFLLPMFIMLGFLIRVVHLDSCFVVYIFLQKFNVYLKMIWAEIKKKNHRGLYSILIVICVQAIAKDAALSRCKIIAEPWDCGGLYLVGKFPNWDR